MLGDVDLPAPHEPAFHLFGEDAASSVAANKLNPCFGQLIEAALVCGDRRTDVAITSGNQAATINVRQQVLAVCQPRSGINLAVCTGLTTCRLSPNA